MTIQETRNDTTLTVSIIGRLDTTTAPELDAYLNEHTAGVTALVLDLSGLAYISSAGLRVLLSAHKKMSLSGSMTLTHVNETVMEVLEITGFADILSIK